MRLWFFCLDFHQEQSSILESPCWFWSWPWPCLRKVNCAVLCPEFASTFPHNRSMQLHAVPDVLIFANHVVLHFRTVQRLLWGKGDATNHYIIITCGCPANFLIPRMDAWSRKTGCSTGPTEAAATMWTTKKRLGTAPFRIVGLSVASWSEAFFGLCQIQ